jgi:hypothetical protein
MPVMRKRTWAYGAVASVMLLAGGTACSANKPTVSDSTVAGVSSKPTVVGASSTTAAVAAAGEAAAGETGNLLDYYTKLGMEPTVAKCYTEQLTKLGVKTIEQLEGDQELAAKASQAFDVCVAVKP